MATGKSDEGPVAIIAIETPSSIGKKPIGRRRTGRPVQCWLAATWIAYAVMLGILCCANHLGPERWWPTCLNLYLPQWLWLLPGLALMGAMLRWTRRFAWTVLPLLVWVACSVMGLHWQPAFTSHHSERPVVRLMTYNIKYGRGDITAIEGEIEKWNPDILVLQDVANAMTGSLGRALVGRNIRAFGQYVVASRLPIQTANVRWISFPGAHHTCYRCTVSTVAGPVILYDAHFLTPREGLAAFRAGDGGAIAELQRNAGDRLIQARALAALVRSETLPVIVAGDLNAPEPSLVCRTLHDAGLHDAFSQAGNGFGYTYGHSTRLAHSYLRIDHIMFGRQLGAARCWTGGSAGSDHRPVVADIEL